MLALKASLPRSNANGSIAFAIARGIKRERMCSTTLRCSIPGNDAMVTLATSARTTTNSGQPDLSELSTEMGQDQITEVLASEADRSFRGNK